MLDAGGGSICVRISKTRARFTGLTLGVHRFQRVSPFDANGKRHTSFVSVLATPIQESSISSAKEIDLPAKDLLIETMRAQVDV
jgi:protein subunit release factor B